MRRLLLLLALVITVFPALPVTAQACETGTSLRAGLTVRVRTGVNVRAEAGLNARDIGGLSAGDVVTLIGGPVCPSALTWWQIGGEDAGWIAESSQSATFLEAIAPVPAALIAPLDGLRVQFAVPASVTRPADQCPPLSGEISVNFAGVSDPLASGGETAFFVDGGYGVPLPALCIPSARAAEATVLAPDNITAPARILPVADNGNFVRATLPEAALLQPGLWRLTVGDFTLGVQMTGPFAPLMDARAQDGTTQVLLAGFAPSEQVAILGADVTDGMASNLRVVTITTDPNGGGGANLDGFAMPVLAAVSESGLIALPSSVQALDLENAANRSAAYDALVIALWGYEALGLPTPTPTPEATATNPPTLTPEPTFPPTLTPEPTITAPPIVTPQATTSGDPTAAPTGIINLPTRDPAATAEPTPEATSTATLVTGDGCTYVVKSGDTFFRIALANGLTTLQLREANPQITDTWLIFVGDVLNIPGCGQGLP